LNWLFRFWFCLRRKPCTWFSYKTIKYNQSNQYNKRIWIPLLMEISTYHV
jgi:hypothetical protein